MSKEIDSSILHLYEIKKLLGSGAYGHVWKVIDKQSNNEMALKKIYGAFLNDVDAQRTYREITVLHELDHYNIIKLFKVHRAKNNSDLYLVFEFMESDLQSLVG
jgi:mitogen-activated protein kinase 15